MGSPRLQAAGRCLEWPLLAPLPGYGGLVRTAQRPMTSPHFAPAPASGPPPEGCIDVWLIELDAEVAEADNILSRDENARAARFHFDRDRRRFTAAHVALRRILGGQLDRDPAELRFGAEPRGKPFLADHHQLHFNLSHSGERALLGVTGIAPLGVDIEAHRELGDLDALARRFFAAGECASLDGLTEELRHEAFFRCWTRKEAYIKALGHGLSHPLDSFEVSIARDESARFLSFDDPAELARGWALSDLAPGRGYEGALAIAAPHDELRLWVHSADLA